MNERENSTQKSEKLNFNHSYWKINRLYQSQPKRVLMNWKSTEKAEPEQRYKETF